MTKSIEEQVEDWCKKQLEKYFIACRGDSRIACCEFCHRTKFGPVGDGVLNVPDRNCQMKSVSLRTVA
ncbi:MAG: hypothetical protein IIT53_12100, partial [Fibrobacter sp.]|nr:hypothetical protein [Fibrobacter sp.]